MSKVITYYFTPVSPWSYLGHDRLVALAAKHGATIEPRLMDLGKVFPVSGGLPLPKRSPQRQAYRLVELARWRDALGVPINVPPKFAASSGDLATHWILAALEGGAAPALTLAGAVMRSRWAEEGDIADAATLAALARASGLDPQRLAARAAAPDDRGALRSSRRSRRSTPAFSARHGTSARASRSGDRIGSTSSPANWQNSVLFASSLPGGPAGAGRRGARAMLSACTSVRTVPRTRAPRMQVPHLRYLATLRES